MPFKLVPPRPGRSPFWSVRGTHLGFYINRSTGLSDKAKAAARLRLWREDTERGRLAAPGEPLFADAVAGYLQAGGDPRFLGEIDAETGEWRGLTGVLGGVGLAAIDQSTIDHVAAELLPEATAATRNRQVYTPVSAVLKHAGRDFRIRRPKGWRGTGRTDWLTPEQAFRILGAAEHLATAAARDAADKRLPKLVRASRRARARAFGEMTAFLEVLLYTGLRLGEAIGLTCDRVELAEAAAFVPTTKNGTPRAVHLPPPAVAALGNLPGGLDRPGQRVFRIRKHGRLYAMLDEIKTAAGPDVAFAGFHTLRHTWATWMRRYAGLDTTGLVATRAWSDRASAARYEHTTVSEEARKADRLPVRSPPRRIA